MTASVTSHTALRLYAIAHDKAVTNIGEDVFAFQNDTVKHALVAVEIINLVNTQDDDIDSAKVRRLLFDLTLFNNEQYNR